MIINTSEVKHIYLANNYVDLRNSIDGLALIVSMQFDLDVMMEVFSSLPIVHETDLKFYIMKIMVSGFF